MILQDENFKNRRSEIEKSSEDENFQIQSDEIEKSSEDENQKTKNKQNLKRFHLQ